MVVKLRRAGKLALISVFALWTLFPILWSLSTSVKRPADYFSNPPVWIPDHITFGHYAGLFGSLGGWGYLVHSLVVGVSSTVLTLAVAIPAGYVMGTSEARSTSRTSFLVLAQRTLPPVVLLIPLYLVYTSLNLLDTYVGLVLAFSTFNVPFAIWLLKGFFGEAPKEVREQSLTDGLSEFQSLYRIVLPMVAPGVAVVAFFSFLAAWNELMLSITFTGENTATMTRLISSLLQSPTGTEFGTAAAAAVISIVPAVFLTVLGQRYLVRGLTAGSVK